MTSTAETLTVRPQERIYAPAAGARADKWLLPLIAATLIYALLIGIVLIESWFAPPVIPQVEEIPVEIVVQSPEPPPPPPPPPEKREEPKPPQIQQPLDEKPAVDAPRAGTSDKVDSADAPDKVKPPPPSGVEQPAEAPKAEPPPAPETPPMPSQEAPTPPIPQAPDATQTAPPPKPAAAPPASPAQKPALAKGKPVPMFDSLPEVDFGGAALKAPVAGGQARATYLTIVYGMIMPRFTRLAGRLKGYHAKRGTVTFGLDGHGRLTMRLITEESGSHELDEAAFDAIGEAGPFPPTPTGVGVNIDFHYTQQD